MNPPSPTIAPPTTGGRFFSKTTRQIAAAFKRAVLTARASKDMRQAFEKADAERAAALIDEHAAPGSDCAGIGGWDQGLRWRRFFVRQLRASPGSIKTMAPRIIQLANTPEGVYFAMTAACEAASRSRGPGDEPEWVAIFSQSLSALSNRWEFLCEKTPASKVFFEPGVIHDNLDRAWQTPLDLREIWDQSSRLFPIDRGALALGMSVEHLLGSMLRKQWERLSPGGQEAIKAAISQTSPDFLGHLRYILQRCIFPGYPMRQALEPWLEGLLNARAELAIFEAVLKSETPTERSQHTTPHRL